MKRKKILKIIEKLKRHAPIELLSWKRKPLCQRLSHLKEYKKQIPKFDSRQVITGALFLFSHCFGMVSQSLVMSQSFSFLVEERLVSGGMQVLFLPFSIQRQNRKARIADFYLKA